MRSWQCFCVAILSCTIPSLPLVGLAAEDWAERQAAALVAGVDSFRGVTLSIAKETRALVARDDHGMVIEEIFPGTSSKKITVAGSQLLAGYGKDRRGRLSVLLRIPDEVKEAQKVQISGFILVLSPEASVTIVMDEFRTSEIIPSRTGQVYLLQQRGDGRWASERLTAGWSDR